MAKYKRIIYSIVFIFTFAFILPLQARGEGKLTITFFDIGEGDAAYIETPTNEKLLIDTGNPVTSYRIVNFLKEKKINSLDSIFITHPHPDHIGGIFQVLSAFDVKSIYDNGQPIPKIADCDLHRWYAESARKENYKAVKSGDIFRYGAMKVHVLWPNDPSSADWNSNSLVLKVVYGEKAFLFMGDANAFVEEKLLESNVKLKAEALKAGHHGANDATTDKFLQSVSPEFAIISANENNIRGYPHKEIIDRLKQKNITIFTTYSDGNLTFTMDGPNGAIIKN